MLREVRTRLRKISYYSRDRPRTAWTRALEAALPISLLLAFLAGFAAEGLVDRDLTIEKISGVLIGDPTREVVAPILEDGRRPDPEDGLPYGEWKLTNTIATQGWPFASKTRQTPATVDFSLYDDVEKRVDVQLEIDAPERVAIENSLERADRADLRDAWRSTTPAALERDWVHSALNVAAWWVILFMTAALVIRTLGFLALVTHARRSLQARMLSGTGICPSCRYDLRGLEFNERCPECGALIE